MKQLTNKKSLPKAIRLQNLVLGGLMTTMVSYAPWSGAGPVGGDVVGGSGEITSPDDNTTQVNQHTDLMAINWDSFNLGIDEKVLYLQPSSSSIVLNRILDDGASVIQGRIEANGHVLLVNPNGVLFTQTASIDVHGIAVSGLDINPADFLNGSYKLTGEAGKAGSVVNYGVINASSAALFGKRVENHGLISADLISLAGADEAILSFDADGLMGVAITRQVLEKEAGVESAVLNAGDLRGQKVLLDAAVASDLFNAAVNNSGTVRAQGIDTRGGVIRLTGSGGAVVSSGTLDASGALAGGEVYVEGDSVALAGAISVASAIGQAGQVQLLGDAVALNAGARVSADGAAGGGKVMLGGDARGGNGVRTATTTLLSEGAQVSASATDAGDGGDIILWADDSAVVKGQLQANGVGAGGAGGFIETSGKQTIQLGGLVEARAGESGQSGLWLIDPGQFEIGAGATGTNYLNVDELATSLLSQDVTLISNVSGDVDGILLSADLNIAHADALRHRLTLEAAGGTQADGVTLNASISASGGYILDLALIATGDVSLAAGQTVNLNGGNLEVTAGHSFSNAGSINLGTGVADLAVGQAGAGSDNLLGFIDASTVTVNGGTGRDLFRFSDADKIFSFDGTSLSAALDGVGAASALLTGFEAILAQDAVLELTTPAASVNLARASDWSITAQVSGADFLGFAQVNGSEIVVNSGLLATDNGEFSLLEDSGAVRANEVQARVDDGGSNSGSLRLAGVAAVNGTRRLLSPVANTSLALTGSDNSLAAAGIAFGDVELVLGSGADQLLGSAADDSFSLAGTQQLSAAGIDFSGISEVLAGAGNNHLSGSNDAESFTTDGNQVSVSGMDFTGISTVDAGDGVDSVAGNGADIWTLSELGGARFGLIRFTHLEEASAQTAVLNGSIDVDVFTLKANNRAEAAGIDFSGINTVYGGGARDQVVAIGSQDVSLQSSNNAINTSGIQFYDVSEVVNGTVRGTNSSDVFTVTGSGTLTAKGMDFSNISEVQARGNNDTDIVNGGISWTLIGSKSAEVDGIRFVSIDEVNTTGATLTGRITDDNFLITADGLEIADLRFSGLASVAGGGGTDTLADQVGTSVDLLGPGSVQSSGIIFSALARVSDTGQLVGTSGADLFNITDAGELTVDGIEFRNVTSVDAGDGQDSASTLSETAWQLQGLEAARHSGIDFSDLEAASSATSSLSGSGGADIFTVMANKHVAVSGITFSSTLGGGLQFINGGGGTDRVIALAGESVALQFTANSIRTSEMTFTAVEQVTGDSVMGTTGDDTFTITGANSLEVNGMAFSDVSAVAAGSDSDNDTVLAGSAWSLTGGAKAASSDSISFTEIEVAVGSSLQGSAGDDVFNTDGISLIANDIRFTGISSVNAGGGHDAATGTGADSWSLNAVEDATFGVIRFTDLEAAASAATSLAGSAGDDVFTVVGANQVQVSGISFSSTDAAGLSFVDGGAGSDRVIALAQEVVELTDTDNRVVSSGMTFNAVEWVDNGLLQGSDGDDSFVITGLNQLQVAGIDFANIASVQGEDGNDSVTGASGWTLTGGNNNARANEAISFSQIESASGGSLLTGSAGDDNFSSDGSQLTANDIAFSGIIRVEAGDGDDSATGTGAGTWLLNGQEDASFGSLRFTDLEAAASAATSLTGSALDDVFTVVSANQIQVSGVTFSSTDVAGLSFVDGGTGSDRVNVLAQENVELTGIDNRVISSGVTFDQVEQVHNGVLQATGADENFAILGQNQLQVAAIDFFNVASVQANGGDDSVSGGFDWSLSDAANTAQSRGITFAGIEWAQGSGSVLNGSAGADQFTLLNSDQINVRGITFTSTAVTGFTAVNAGAGTDTLSLQSGDWVDLLGLNSLQFGSLTVAGIDRVENANIRGTAGDDLFRITGNRSLNLLAMDFVNVLAVDGLAGQDSASTNLSGAWQLEGFESARHSNMLFTDIEAASSFATVLNGTAGDDLYEVIAPNQVQVSGLTFSSTHGSGLQTINAGAGTDQLIARVGDSLALQAADNALRTAEMTFTGIDQVQHGVLFGTGANENFVITGANALTAKGMSFTDIGAVFAGAGSDSVSGAGGWTLDGADYIATANEAIRFSDIESAQGGSIITGSAAGDSFSTDGSSLLANGIAFTGIVQVDALGGADSVTGTGADNWILNGLQDATFGGVHFTGIEAAVSQATSLTGTLGDDVYTLMGNNQVQVSGITFSSSDAGGLQWVNGGLGNDRVIAQVGQVVYLQGLDNSVITSQVNFTAVEQVQNGTVQGTDGNDLFTVLGLNSLQARGITFSDVSAVAGNGGQDHVAGGFSWQLTGADQAASTQAIQFTGIASADSAALLNGSAGDDSFVLSSSALVANNIAFTGVTQVIGGGGVDSATGATGVNWSSDGNLAASNNGVAFTGLSTAVTDSQGVLGSAGNDVIVVIAADDLIINGVTFRTDAAGGFTQVDGLAGQDSLTARSGAWMELTGVANQLVTDGISFSAIEAVSNGNLRGSDLDDNFVMDGAGLNFAANGIAFSSLAELDAAGGTDTVSIINVAAEMVSLGGQSVQINGVRFHNIENASGQMSTLSGSALDDSLATLSGVQVQLNGVTISSTAVGGFVTIDLGLGDDQLQSATSPLVELAGSAGALYADAILISGLESANVSNLLGSIADDQIQLVGAQSLLANGIAVSGVNSLDLRNGTDRVTGLDGQAWTSTGTNRASQAGVNFISLEIADGNFAQVSGTSGNDLAVFGNDQLVTLNGVQFASSSAITSVNLAAGTDQLSTAGATGVLSGTANGLRVGATLFSGLESASLSNLQGSSGDDTFNFATGNLSADGMAFTGVTVISGAAGNDQVISDSGWQFGTSVQSVWSGGLLFTQVERASGAATTLQGSTDADTVTLHAANQVSANGVLFSSTAVTGFSSIDLGAGADAAILDPGLIAELTGVGGNLQVGSLQLISVQQVQAGQLRGSSGAEQFVLTGQNALQVANMQFSGLSSVDALAGVDQLTSSGAVTLTGSAGGLLASGIHFSSLELIDANSLLGSAGADVFSLSDTGSLSAGGMQFSGLTSVSGGGGVDSFHNDWTDSYQLGPVAGQVQVGALALSEIESFTGATRLMGTDADESFALSGPGAVSAGGLSFNGVTLVDGGLGADSVSGRNGEVWRVQAPGEVMAAAVVFTAIEQASAAAGEIVGRDAALVYTQVDSGAFVVDQVRFNGVAQITAGTLDDQINLQPGAALTQSGDSLAIATTRLLQFDRVNGQNLSLLTDAGDNLFQLTGNHQQLTSGGILFSGLASVDAGAGQNRLQADAGDNQFQLSETGSLTSAGIAFSGLRQVDGGNGSDSVSGTADGWYLQVQAGQLADNAIGASVSGITLQFTNLESVAQLGSLYGADVATDYQFNGINQLNVAGMSLSGVQQLYGGNSINSLLAPDLDAQWQLTDAGGQLSSGNASLRFTGISDIFAGALADSFTLVGGDWRTLDTGAGNDAVSLGAASLDTLLLGAGDDSLILTADRAAPALLSGGAGQDSLINGLAGLEWRINDDAAGVNQLGDFSFSQFESLNNDTQNLLLSTNAALVFNGSSVNLAGMSLDFNAGGLAQVNTEFTGAPAVSGQLVVQQLVLSSAGDIQLDSQIGVLNIQHQGQDIDVQVNNQGDLLVERIDAGEGGTIVLNSTDLSDLLVSDAEAVHFVASDLTLGSVDGQFGFIGDQAVPVRANVSGQVQFTALSFVQPLFVDRNPALFQFSGNQVESVYGAQAAQGVKSAVQTAVEDFAQVDPAIFEAVSPYTAGANALAGGEYRLVAGVLLPAEATAAGQGGDQQVEPAPQETHPSTNDPAPATPAPAPTALPQAELKPGYDEVYKVQEGDTLWDIANRFLKDPMKWMELWQQNPEIKNPDMIYIGDVIRVIIVKGRAFLTIRREPDVPVLNDRMPLHTA